ncbi:MAG: hypothetical protein LC659_00695 [Myxococcales bacterium]|nr:hypothetical protein [Myxococcales bacterium]
MTFARPRVLILVPLGFAARLPYMLASSTLSAWLTQAGGSLAAVSLFSAVALPYRSSCSGHRSSIDAGGRCSAVDEAGYPVSARARRARRARRRFAARRAARLRAALAVGVAVCAASQDIPPRLSHRSTRARRARAAGTAVYVFGYVAAMLVTGGLALVVADHLPFGRVS